MEDAKIIELFFSRSEQAIGELSGKYGRLLSQIAQNILRNQNDAEECVNDAYFGVWNRIPPERPLSLCAYACRVVRNLAVKRLEEKRAKKRDSQYDVALEEIENCLASLSDPAAICEGRELTGLLERFLDTLKREERILFVRRYWFADSVTELAAETGMSPGNVSVRLSRMRKKLREYLETYGY